MNKTEKLYPLWILLSISLGIGAGQIHLLKNIMADMLIPLLIAMLFFSFLQISFREIGQAFAHRTFFLSSIGINFILTPILAWSIASLILPDEPAVWIGFILLMVTPCTDWYIIFTQMARGNTALSTSILPVNLLLQILLLPFYLYLFTGTTDEIPFTSFIQGAIAILLIPLFTAWLVRLWMGRSGKREKWLAKLHYVPVFLLCTAIIAIFAAHGDLLTENPSLLVRLLTAILLFFTLMFVVARAAGKWLGLSKRDLASFHMTTLARNSPIGLAIAISAFPEEPLVALALVAAPLIELPVLAAAAWIILKLDH
ncbi:arsenic resistance protein [Jeotgalibacillus proteolyticus]|uniref:arsenic resistance protein n=1 Tax=Jeotgalibacillus proteolyticus TaxID=2082395 RepID=UPI003CF75ECA